MISITQYTGYFRTQGHKHAQANTRNTCTQNTHVSCFFNALILLLGMQASLYFNQQLRFKFLSINIENEQAFYVYFEHNRIIRQSAIRK
jgi:hypothetical protein